MKLSDRELATVLAALRYCQSKCTNGESIAMFSPDHFDEFVTPLTINEIDSLCQKLNHSAHA